MPELSILDQRLAEIDRRLRNIQSGLSSAEAPAGDPRAELGALPHEESDVRPGELDVRPAELDPVARALEEPPLEPAVTPPPTRAPLRAAPPAAATDAGVRRAPADEEAPGLLARLRELGEAHERLLELHRELLSQYAEVLAHRAADSFAVPLTAGPFADASAVHAFERALAQLPGVAGVAVREYGGGDRVTLDVRLA